MVNKEVLSHLSDIEELNFNWDEIRECDGSMRFELYYDDSVFLEGNGYITGNWHHSPETYYQPEEDEFDFKGCRILSLRVGVYDEDIDDIAFLNESETEEIKDILQLDLADFLQTQ